MVMYPYMSKNNGKLILSAHPTVSDALKAQSMLKIYLQIGDDLRVTERGEFPHMSYLSVLLFLLTFLGCLFEC